MPECKVIVVSDNPLAPSCLSRAVPWCETHREVVAAGAIRCTTGRLEALEDLAYRLQNSITALDAAISRKVDG